MEENIYATREGVNTLENIASFFIAHLLKGFLN